MILKLQRSLSSPDDYYLTTEDGSVKLIITLRSLEKVLFKKFKYKYLLLESVIIGLPIYFVGEVYGAHVELDDIYEGERIW